MNDRLHDSNQRFLIRFLILRQESIESCDPAILRSSIISRRCLLLQYDGISTHRSAKSAIRNPLPTMLHASSALRSVLFALCPLLFALCSSPSALRPLPSALRSALCALRPVPCALSPEPCALSPAP